MNKARRSQIDAVIRQLEVRESEIGFLIFAEHGDFNGSDPADVIDSLEDAAGKIRDAIEYLKEAQGG